MSKCFRVYIATHLERCDKSGVKVMGGQILQGIDLSGVRNSKCEPCAWLVKPVKQCKMT